MEKFREPYLFFSFIISNILLYQIDTLEIALSIFICLLIVTYCEKSFVTSLKFLQKFIIFFISILLFKLINFRLEESLIFVMKFVNMISLIFIYNLSLPYSKLLDFGDYLGNFVYPNNLRIIIRKILFAFLIGINSVPVLVLEGKKIKRIKLIRKHYIKNSRFSLKNFKENFKIIFPLFHQVLLRATKYEISYKLVGFKFDRIRTRPKNFLPAKRDIFLIMFLIIIIIIRDI